MTEHERASIPDEDNPEWTEAMFAEAERAEDILPRHIGKGATGALLRPNSSFEPERPAAQPVLLDRDIVDAFQRIGQDWVGRINAIPREHKPR